MFKNISFNNFKCLDNKSFELNKLNVFSGYNGRGKSSVLQGLLMLSQSVGNGAGSLLKLHVNGKMVELGEFLEILSDDSRKYIEFDIDTDDSQFETVKLQYSLSEVDPRIGNLSACNINGSDYFDSVGKLETGNNEKSDHDQDNRQLSKAIPEGFLKSLREIHFVSADRIGPTKYVEKTEVPDVHRVDSHGVNTINTIESYNDSVPAEMNLDKTDQAKDFKVVLSEWLNYIMVGGKVSVHSDQSSPVLSLKFDIKERSFSSYNVGFGYSYILSIVVTALIAKKDSIVIIENPEAHLHGQAQSRLTELLAKLASRGVQLFIETHSEHIINGFRKELLKDNCSLSNTDICIYFFDNDFSVKSLKIEPNGKIKNWPEGFFNQETHDLAEIMLLGSKIK